MKNQKQPPPVAERILDGALRLLAKEGPGALQARAIAAACGMSSMVVYSHFGGVPELVTAMTERGFVKFAAALGETPVSSDPVFDLFSMALASRRFALENPHLYDLMFGLSARATYRPGARDSAHRAAALSAFRAGHQHLLAASERLARSGRVTRRAPETLAAQLWSYVHGFVSLELAGHFEAFDDPVATVLAPLGVALCVGMGDSPARARASHAAVLRMAKERRGSRRRA